MQPIDVLRDEQKLTNAPLQVGERVVRGVGHRPRGGGRAMRIPLPRTRRVPTIAVRVRKVAHVFGLPHPVLPGPKGGKPAFGRHAGAGENDDGVRPTNAGGSGLELTVKLARYLLHTVLSRAWGP